MRAKSSPRSRIAVNSRLMSYSSASDWFCSNDGSAFGSGAAAGCALSLIGVVCSHSYTYPDHHNQKPRVSPPAKPPKKNRIEHPNRGPPLPPALTRQNQSSARDSHLFSPEKIVVYSRPSAPVAPEPNAGEPMRISQRLIALTANLALLTLPLNAQEGGLTCASNDGRYRYCRADTQNRVQLVRQISNSRCSQGYSWGFDYRGIWVDRGCRAEFVYGRRVSGGGGSNTGAAVAAGILGAIIVGAAVASAKDDSNNDREQRRRDAYEDGYRHGQRDWA